MDFVSDSLFDGRRFRAFTLVDNFTRECLAIRAAPTLHGSDVAELLDQVIEEQGEPSRIFLDNGPEFISKALDLWAYQAGVTLDFSRPGKTHRQRIHRIIQRKLPRRVLEQQLVLVYGRCTSQDRFLAQGVQ